MGRPWRGLPAATSPEADKLVSAVLQYSEAFAPRHARVAIGVWAGLSIDECSGWLRLSPHTVYGYYREVLGRLPGPYPPRRSDIVRLVERSFFMAAIDLSL
jgi:hypothetical protein